MTRLADDKRGAQAATGTTLLIEESMGRSKEGSLGLEQFAASIHAIPEAAAKSKN